MTNNRINTKKISIKTLNLSDIPTIVDAFKKINWDKPFSLFEKYYQEQEQSKRIVWLAFQAEEFAGYVTLIYTPLYQPFATQNIPEILDLNVLPNFRCSGIGSQLLQIAEEKAASQHDVVGIGVGLYGGTDGGYGPAQRLYIKRGYVPDGLGATYNYQPVMPGQNYCLDDDLVLWFTKKLK